MKKEKSNDGKGVLALLFVGIPVLIASWPIHIFKPDERNNFHIFILLWAFGFLSTFWFVYPLMIVAMIFVVIMTVVFLLFEIARGKQSSSDK